MCLCQKITIVPQPHEGRRTFLKSLSGQCFVKGTKRCRCWPVKDALDNTLTCHCKLPLQPLLPQGSLPQPAGRNDTLHSHPMRGRWRGERWRTDGAKRASCAIERRKRERDRVRGEGGRDRKQSKFLLRVCCISSAD